MFRLHWPTVASQSGSVLVGLSWSHGGMSLPRFSVVPAAATAQRDGISQANCSRPGES